MSYRYGLYQGDVRSFRSDPICINGRERCEERSPFRRRYSDDILYRRGDGYRTGYGEYPPSPRCGAIPTHRPYGSPYGRPFIPAPMGCCGYDPYRLRTADGWDAMGVRDGPSQIVPVVFRLLSEDPDFVPHWTHAEALGFVGLYRNDPNVMEKLGVVRQKCENAIRRLELERAADESSDGRLHDWHRGRALFVFRHLVWQMETIQSHLELNGTVSDVTFWRLRMNSKLHSPHDK